MKKRSQINFFQCRKELYLKKKIIIPIIIIIQEYKPPSSKDIPEDFRLTFHDSKRNTAAGVLGSKAVGEQTMLQGVSVLFALRRAIDSVKKDLGVTEFYTLGICKKIFFLNTYQFIAEDLKEKI